MRDRDLKALEYDKVIALVRERAVSDPGRRAIEALRPSTDAAAVRERLRATAEMADLRAHSGPCQSTISTTSTSICWARRRRARC